MGPRRRSGSRKLPMGPYILVLGTAMGRAAQLEGVQGHARRCGESPTYIHATMYACMCVYVMCVFVCWGLNASIGSTNLNC